MSEFRWTLKHPSGFFAARCEMKEALTLLSDGAFKIYVYVCLQADRRTAQLCFRIVGGGGRVYHFSGPRSARRRSDDGGRWRAWWWNWFRTGTRSYEPRPDAEIVSAMCRT